MDITKAIITAAGRHQRTLPLQTLVDRDGVTRSALRIILDEAVQAGIRDVAVIIQAGDQPAFAAAAGDCPARLHFVEQRTPLGFGHAVLCAREWIGGQPFLLMVGDHLYTSHEQRRCAQQLVEVARIEGCSVSAVQATHESKLPFYGTVGGRLVAGQRGLYTVDRVVEKPTPTEAEQKLIVPGLRAGSYLCFFGMHVLTPMVLELLGELVQEAGERGGVQLSTALSALPERERYLALEIRGQRQDIGVKYGLLMAQLALALGGQDREEVLAQLVELLARRRPTP